MIAELGKSVGSKLGERWVKDTFAPAGLFWLAVAGLWFLKYGFHVPIDAWADNGVLQLSTIVLIIALLVLTSSFADSLTLPMLRILEGYWRFKWASDVGRFARTKASPACARKVEGFF